ncbi:MAG: GvpL/GvpF family gas vesicle protein [Prolixibacteraceae bacterium]
MKQMIYAIISANRDEAFQLQLKGMRGILGEDLQIIAFQEIAAVVSRTNRADLANVKSEAIAFAQVVENISTIFTLLPMRYGSLMDSEEAVVGMLENNYSDIDQNLRKVENKHEFGLKVMCDTEKLKINLQSRSESVGKPLQKSDPESEDSVFREYINRKLSTHRIEEMVLHYVDAIIAEFSGFLIFLEADKKIKKMTTATTIIDAVFLLKKDNKQGLVKAIHEMQNKYPEMNFILTGPWPPYSFIDVNLK